MGEGHFMHRDGRTAFCEPLEDREDELERLLAYEDFADSLLELLGPRWGAAHRWRDRARVLAANRLHELLVHEDSYGRVHLTIVPRADLEPPLERLARGTVDRTAGRLFDRLDRRIPLRVRTSAWTSRPYRPDRASGTDTRHPRPAHL